MKNKRSCFWFWFVCAECGGVGGVGGGGEGAGRGERGRVCDSRSQ